MEAEEREKILEQSSDIRQELKSWEKEFATANGGRKAGREDIKQHPAIAQKYKEYNRIRDVLSGKAAPREESSPQRKISRKRKQETTHFQTPSKRLQISKTPSQIAPHPGIIDPYDSPSMVRNLFTPSKHKALGPTPQKDGQALGLFDLLPDEEEGSPLKAQVTIKAPDNKVHGTPRRTVNQEEDIPGTIRHSRTPLSRGKRFMLDSFATPLKRRHPNEQGGKTPSSVSKLHFSTPSFLRRDSYRVLMPPIDEMANDPLLSPQMARLPKKPLVRGLSSMLAGLRKMEEEAADDDLDALREFENEDDTNGAVPASKKQTVLAEDSQVPLLLGGFDDEALYDSEPDEIKNPPLGQDSQPLKIWKKTGQKRTTRRVTLKPVRSKTQSFPQAAPDPESNDPEDAMPETQNPDTGNFYAEAGNFDSDSGSEYTASEGGTRYRRPNQTKKAGRNVEGKLKTATRKVGAMAHANFKRLKLRNSGAKGGAAHNSRFRRKK